MSTLDVLTPVGQLSQTTGKLLKLDRATAGRGQEGFGMDIRLRFDALTDDAPILAKLFVGTPELYDANRRWDGDLIVKPKQVGRFVITSLEDDPIIKGKGEITRATLICRGLSRSLEVKARLEVGERYEAPVYQVNQAVTVQLTGTEQPEEMPKGKKGGKATTSKGQTTMIFGRTIDRSAVPAVAELVMPEEDQIVEVRTGTKDSIWARAHKVEELGLDSMVTLRDIADGRASQVESVKLIARAVTVVAPEGEILNGMLNRHRSAVNKAKHGRPASWTHIMRAWQDSGQLVDGARLISADVLDRAAELLAKDAEKAAAMLTQRGGDLPPPADDAKAQEA